MQAIDNVLLLGGTGFVGSALCEALVEPDGAARLVVASRRPQRAKHLLPLPGLELVRANVHEDADLEMARQIAYNAKVQRPGVCNAAETLLVHESVAGELLPPLLEQLSGAGVELVGDAAVRASADGVEVGEAT